VVCNDGNPCTEDSCNPATGNCVHTEISHPNDADCDGIPDDQDPDDDNDGINDEDENPGCGNNPDPCCGDADCDELLSNFVDEAVIRRRFSRGFLR
jgi:hypothetical protein